MNIFNLICIGCPKGCQLKVSMDESKVISVEGNSCKVGEDYGKTELTNPTRILTTTIKLNNGSIEYTPVKTSIPIPKDSLFSVISYLSTVEIESPVSVGDVIVSNILNLGADIISTRKI